MNVSISGGNHSASGARLKAEAISVIECAMVNAVTIADQLAEPSERNDEAEHEQQMVGPLEDVAEPELARTATPPDAIADRAGPVPGRR